MTSIVISAAVVTISDSLSTGNGVDHSGQILIGLLETVNATVTASHLIPDDLETIKGTLQRLCESSEINLVITTGGTGLSPRDNTPEATRMIIEKEIPGLSEAMRVETLKHTPFAMISRAVCGIKQGTLIINLPGSPSGVSQCFEVIRPVLRHSIALIGGFSHPDAN
jgi:molybdopterin adenylyltransferase